jgi:hypothetical protein
MFTAIGVELISTSTGGAFQEASITRTMVWAGVES